MINSERGEVGLVINGVERPMRLTLNALAAVEAELDERSLLGLVERFETGGFRARELLVLLWGGLNGGGWPVSQDELGKSVIEGGPVAAARAAARLLQVTFAGQAT